MVFQKQSQYPLNDTQGNTFTFICHHYINVQQEPQLLEELAQGNLFKFTNPQTGEVSPIPYPCLLEDEEKQLLIYFIPEGSVKSDSIAPALFEGATNDYSNYTIRLCESVTAFMEKINIFFAGYLDTEVECVKILTHALISEQHPNLQLSYMLFNETSDGAKIMIVTSDGIQQADYNEELVTIIKERVGDQLYPEKGQLHLIDSNWAADALQLR